jgi:hypothetical protein
VRFGASGRLGYEAPHIPFLALIRPTSHSENSRKYRIAPALYAKISYVRTKREGRLCVHKTQVIPSACIMAPS